MAYKTYNNNGEKWCGKCKAYHHVSSFGKSNQSKDGLAYICSSSRRVELSKPEINPVDMIHPIISTILDIPILTSQVTWKYQRPDFYDIYISKAKQS